VADLLEIEDANPFRVRAYRTAAQTLRQESRRVADMVADGADLSELENIGEDLAGKIETIVETGSLPLLEELEGRTPAPLADLMHIEGLGPKRVRRLHEELGITTREELKAAAEQEKIRALEGFGETMEQNILDRIDQAAEQRTLWAEAEPVATALADHLRGADGVDRVAVAGSFRRRKETVGDLDVLVLADDSVPVMDRFVDYEDVADVLAEGDTRASVVFRSGLQVDVRVVPSNSYGAALLYFTGSKAHNVALRNRALDRDLKINEYGVFETNGEEAPVGGATEEEMYDTLGLPYIVPELREQRGEIEAAEAGTLPALIEADDLRGNLHTHTTDSDGAASIQEMADAAAERGFEYLAITDHSPHVGIVNGLDADALRHQVDRIHALNDERDDLTLLAGIEVDILKDGALDLPDDVLAALDVCIAAVHTNLGLSEEVQTERILRALDNPHVHMLAHPTGRRMGQRAPYDLDVPRLIEGAAERGVILELNAQPDRLDLNDTYCKAAKEAGVMIAIGADAHRPDSLDLLHYGVAQARRGWLTAEDVLNTRTWPEVKVLIDR
jgi:DNA polymerase (family 10)